MRSAFDVILDELNDSQLNDDGFLLKTLRSLPKDDLKYLNVIVFAAHGIGKKITIAKTNTNNNPGSIIPLPNMLWTQVTDS